MNLHKSLATTMLALGALLAAFIVPAASAQTAEETIKSTMESRLRPGAKIDGVKKTPYFGLYEVRMGQEIIYTDEKVTFVFAGDVLDGKNFENHTKARLEELSAIKFNDLPLEKGAFKIVKGTGARKVAYFADPNCGYCKKFEQETLHNLTNATIYVVPYAILSEDSVKKAQSIWCAANRPKSWNDWMLGGKAPELKTDCENPVTANQELGRRLNITGTPTMFFEDGKRVVGAVDRATLDQRLAQVAQAAKK